MWRSHEAAHTTQPWAGHRQQSQALPSVAKAIPISGWWSWHHCLPWGSLAMRILLGKIEFLDAKKGQAHPSVVIKTTVRLPPLLLLALGKALPWEYQVGRLVMFQIQKQESRKEFLHSTRPAKGLLSSICSLQGIWGLSPSGGRGRTEYKALWGKCIYTTVPINPSLPPSATSSHCCSFHQTLAAGFSYPLAKL